MTFSKELQEDQINIEENDWKHGVQKQNGNDQLWKIEKENLEMHHLRLLNQNNSLQMRLKNLENLFFVNSTLNGGSAFSMKKQ